MHKIMIYDQGGDNFGYGEKLGPESWASYFEVTNLSPTLPLTWSKPTCINERLMRCSVFVWTISLF